MGKSKCPCGAPGPVLFDPQGSGRRSGFSPLIQDNGPRQWRQPRGGYAHDAGCRARHAGRHHRPRHGRGQHPARSSISTGHGARQPPAHQDAQDPGIAKMQMDAGAIGITCQKLGEVEVFADAGVADDILLTFNVVGAAKTERLIALIKRLKRMAVVLDNETVARGLSEAGVRHGVDIRFLVECDTGLGRNGVQTPEAALDLARSAMNLPRMQFEGLMTFPTAKARARGSSSSARCSFSAAPASGAGRLGRRHARRCRRRRLPDADRASRRHLRLQRRHDGDGRRRDWDDCALRVRTTVVSRPTDDRAILDAGSKVLTYDQYFAKGFGRIVEYPDAVVAGLSEEHGIVDLSRLQGSGRRSARSSASSPTTAASSPT